MFEIAIIIMTKLSNVIIILLAGYLAALFLKIDRHTIAYLLFYIISPALFFPTIAKIKFEFDVLLFPIVMVILSSIVSFIVCNVKAFYPSDQIRNFLAFSGGNGNVGYFLLPLAWSLFNEEILGMYILVIVGNIIYENTVGFYVAARSNFSIKDSLQKILKFPSIYALFLGLIFSAFSIEIPKIFDDLFIQARGAYTILGMMIIGVALAEIKWTEIDFYFITSSFIAKFLLSPLVALCFIFCDNLLLHLYNKDIHHVILLASVAPLAANSITICSVIGISPQKAASSVILSTIFAIIYIPFIVYVFGIK